MATVVLEMCKISPPAAAEDLSLPVIFFDMLFYDYPANPSVLFFHFPCSKENFMEAIVPDLKKSLSLTLTHFLPLTGNIVHPLDPENKPIIRYLPRDSVSFTVSVSEADLQHLTGNHPRVSDEFYAFAPQLPPAVHSECSIACPVLAVQVTLFPGHGICVGIVTHHAVADASTVVSFMQAWALINRSSMKPDHDAVENNKTLLIQGNFLPSYDRKTVVNINGLDSIYWDLIVRTSCPIEPPPVKFPTEKVRCTLFLKEDKIQKLKEIVRVKRPGIEHLSSYTVTCALLWVCSAKSGVVPGGEIVVEEDHDHYFCFGADCRGRLNPPLPSNYFGNCVALGNVELKHSVLTGDDGFVEAVECIGLAIRQRVYCDMGIVHRAEYWPDEALQLMGKPQLGVAGSPKFDFYAIDYGWGRPKKFEILFIDETGSISLCKSGEFEGGLEIGVSKTKSQLELFTTVFTEVLRTLMQ